MPELPTKHAAGCVVYRRDQASLRVLLIRDKYGRWTLPKGHLELGENEQEAAVREVLEETGITGTLGPLIGRVNYTIHTKKGDSWQKQVAFFLLQAGNSEARPQAEEGISAAEWYVPRTALVLVGYMQVRNMLESAVRMLE